MLLYLSQVIVTKVNRFSKDDLDQIIPDYFQFLDPQKLVEVAQSLHGFAVKRYYLLLIPATSEVAA